MNTILIATDGSVAAQAAVDEGLELAHETGATVTFVGVRTRDTTKPLRPALEQAASLAEDRGIEAAYEVMTGDPAHEIVRLARLREADAIVLGSRRPATAGSVTQLVARDADCPVVVVKARAPALRLRT
jgi:nucleotide-binding universal stress UspA family protein